MKIAGTHPQEGLRVSLELHTLDAAAAHYRGTVFTPLSSHPVSLAVDLATGASTVSLGEGIPLDPSSLPATLADAEVAFLRQLGHQLWRLSTQTSEEQGGGRWPRRVQRWRAAKGR
jgi:hypothetical protein